MSNDEYLQGTFDIHRTQGGETPYFSIEIGDALSGCRVVCAEISPHELAEALGGLSARPIRFRWFPAEPIGKKLEVKTVTIKCAPPYGNDAKLKKAVAAMRKLEVDGWKGREKDLKNHHNHRDDGVRVVFTRHVEVPR